MRILNTTLLALLLACGLTQVAYAQDDDFTWSDAEDEATEVVVVDEDSIEVVEIEEQDDDSVRVVTDLDLRDGQPADDDLTDRGLDARTRTERHSLRAQYYDWAKASEPPRRMERETGDIDSTDDVDSVDDAEDAAGNVEDWWREDVANTDENRRVAGATSVHDLDNERFNGDGYYYRDTDDEVARADRLAEERMWDADDRTAMDDPYWSRSRWDGRYSGLDHGCGCGRDKCGCKDKCGVKSKCGCKDKCGKKSKCGCKDKCGAKDKCGCKDKCGKTKCSGCAKKKCSKC